MKKDEKDILKFLISKELKLIEKQEADIEFPSLDFIKSADIYERELKQMMEKLK